MPEKLKQPHGKRATKNPNGWLKNNNPPCDLRAMPKCTARSKSTAKRCRNIAMKNKRVCYLHGGKSPGARRGNQNALKHGRYASGAIVERKYVRSVTKRLLATISAVTKMAEELRKNKKDGR
jgi:hypothetical protein